MKNMKLPKIALLLFTMLTLSGLRAAADPTDSRLMGEWRLIDGNNVTPFTMTLSQFGDATFNDGTSFNETILYSSDSYRIDFDFSISTSITGSKADANPRFQSALLAPLESHGTMFYRVGERLLPHISLERCGYLSIFFSREKYDNDSRPDMLFILSEASVAQDPLNELDIISLEESLKATEILIVDENEIIKEIRAADQGGNPGIGMADFQDDNLSEKDRIKSDVIVASPAQSSDDDKVFTTAEVMPTFPGGEAVLMKYVAEHIRYPARAAEEGIQGRVIVKFVVKADGSIGDVMVLRSRDADLDKEAVRLVKSLPRFTAGKMNGKPVNCWYTMPVSFKLNR